MRNGLGKGRVLLATNSSRPRIALKGGGQESVGSLTGWHNEVRVFSFGFLFEANDFVIQHCDMDKDQKRHLKSGAAHWPVLRPKASKPTCHHCVPKMCAVSPASPLTIETQAASDYPDSASNFITGDAEENALG